MGLLLGLLGGGGLVYFIRPLPEKTISKRDAALLREELLKTDTIINTMQRSQYDSLMRFVLGQVEKDLENRPDRTLRPETIDKIAALSYALLPYRQEEGDSISEKKWSPERGQLLLLLLASRIDTSSLRLIFEKTSFAHAQLAGAYLAGAYLRGIDLQEADLRGAQLQGADLTSADLRYANLWGAHMPNVYLSEANLKLSEMSWTNLNGADLKGANLEEATLVSARMRKANLQNTILDWANLRSSLLEETDLSHSNIYKATFVRSLCSGAHFSGSKMASCNMTDAILSGANLTGCQLTDVIFIGTDLSDVVVGTSDWLNQLEGWNVVGTPEVQKNYQVHSRDSLILLQRQ